MSESMNKLSVRRGLLSIFGLLLNWMFAGVFQFVAFGVDPFQCFVNGCHAVLPFPFGTLYVLLNAAVLLFSLFADRHYIGLATLINMFLLGYVVQFTYGAICAWLPSPALALRILLMPVALLGLCVSGSLYITADLGVSTYDAVALIISNTWHRMPFHTCRILTDLVCVLLGSALYLMGGHSLAQLTAIAGVGTVLTAFCMGPVIAWCNRHISQPLLMPKELQRGQ